MKPQGWSRNPSSSTASGSALRSRSVSCPPLRVKLVVASSAATKRDSMTMRVGSVQAMRVEAIGPMRKALSLRR